MTPPGYHVANFDPNLNSSANNEIYDANFIPGFQAGLTETSISWVSGEGFGRIGYWIGPWSHDEDGLPHLAVGPQCCNFVEVAHTQQFREPSWGDYYYVKAGFGPPGVNLENYTSDFKAPADVGLRTDWNWTVQFSLDWAVPSLLNQSNEWAAIGIAATQYVPGVQGNLVYTVVNLWMDRNSSSGLSPSAVGTERMVEPDVVVYHPVQILQRRERDGIPQPFEVPRRHARCPGSLLIQPCSCHLLRLSQRGGIQLQVEHHALVLQGDDPERACLALSGALRSGRGGGRRNGRRSGDSRTGSGPREALSFATGPLPQMTRTVTATPPARQPDSTSSCRSTGAAEARAVCKRDLERERIVRIDGICMGARGGWEKLKKSRGSAAAETSAFSGGSRQLYSMKWRRDRWLRRVAET